MNHNKNLNLTKDHSPRKTRRKMRPEQVKSSVLTLDNIKQWNGLKSHQAFHATLDRDGRREIYWEAIRAANAHPEDAG